MDTSIKVNLSIVLPGSTMLSEQECSKQLKDTIIKKGKKKIITKTVYNKENNTENRIFLDYKDNDGIRHREPLFFMTRNTIPCKKSINISKEAYDYMVSTECPAWEKMGEWKQLSRIKRLTSHMQRICDNEGGISFEFRIVED